jgi:hypothetical protein
MTTATLLTLLVVPVFYTFFDDVRAVFSTALERAVASRRPTEESSQAKAVA